MTKRWQCRTVRGKKGFPVHYMSPSSLLAANHVLRLIHILIFHFVHESSLPTCLRALSLCGKEGTLLERQGAQQYSMTRRGDQDQHQDQHQALPREAGMFARRINPLARSRPEGTLFGRRQLCTTASPYSPYAIYARLAQIWKKASAHNVIDELLLRAQAACVKVPKERRL